MVVSLKRLGLAVLGVVLLVVLVVGGVGAAVATGAVQVEQPTLESVDVSWGQVTNESTTIDTQVVVNNPNPVGIPALVSIEYAVTMNNITMATGDPPAIGLSTGETTIDLETSIDNEKIPAWWASHINNGEHTVVAIKPAVEVPFYSRDLPSQTRTVETDILSSLTIDEERSLTVGDTTLLTITGSSAEWGEATEERTPLSYSLTLRNPSDTELRFSELRFSMKMNDLEVASGATEGEVVLPPGGTQTVELELVIDNSKLDEWWVSHIRANETTHASIDVVAVTGTGSQAQTVPLSFLSPSFRLQTDILGGGGTNVEQLGAGPGAEFSQPTVESVTTDWETVDDQTTRFVTEVVVDNPNPEDSSLSELLSLDLGVAVRMNDVTVAEPALSDQGLGPGENRIQFSDEVEERDIQAWWVTHINSGEQTTLAIDPRVTADLGFTALSMDPAVRRETITTDLLGSLESTQEQTLEVQGMTVLQIHETRGSWGEASMDQTPVNVEVDATNPTSEQLTITEIGYTVSMNDVTLANGSTTDTTVLSPNDRTTVSVTIPLDNSKLGEWWVTHVEAGGTTTFETSVYVVVEWRGETRRVPIDGLNTSSTFETAFLSG